MASLNSNNLFQSWDLSPQELVVGSQLTQLQKQCIQNQIAQFAQEKIKLQFTPNDLHTYLQREAELQGQINALSYLLTLSAEAEVQTNSAPIHINSSED